MDKIIIQMLEKIIEKGRQGERKRDNIRHREHRRKIKKDTLRDKEK